MSESSKYNQLELPFDGIFTNPSSISEFDGYEILIENPYNEVPKEEYFTKLLPDRSNPFEITEELKIKKILGSGLDYTIDLKKSDNKYEYDLTVYNYQINGAEYKSNSIGFIEVEVSVTWIDKYPDNWKNDSFLARKVLIYDYYKNEFTNKLKPKAESTIYIIFNKNFNDAICCDMVSISTFEKTNIHKMDNPYNNWCLRESLFIESKKVVRGIDNCIKYIMSFLKQRI